MQPIESSLRRPWSVYVACAFFAILGFLPIVLVIIETSDLSDALLFGLLGPLAIVGCAALAFAGINFGRHALLAYYGFITLLSIFGWIAGVPEDEEFLLGLDDVASTLVLISVAALLYLPKSNDWYNNR